MPPTLRRVVPIVVLLGTASLLAEPPPPPPATPAEDTADIIQGVTVADPYRWLEDWGNAKVQAWSDAQNGRTRTYLDALPNRAAVKEELSRLIKASSPSYSGLAARGDRVFALYSDPRFQQPMLVTLNVAADPESRKSLLDPNQLDPKGLTSIDWFTPSGDGSKVAVSLSRSGSEDGTLHVFDAATGREIDAPIDRVQYPTAGGSLAWAADGQGFWYTRYPGAQAPEAERHFHLQAYFHRLGTNASMDPVALGEADGLERISEIFLDNRVNLPTAMAMVQRGDGNDWASYVLREGAPPVRLSTYGEEMVYATFGPDGAVYGISRRGAPNGRVIRLAPPFAPGGLAGAPVIVPEGEVAIQSPGIEFAAGKFFIRDIVGGPNQVRVFELSGKPAGRLPLPEVAAAHEIEGLAGGEVLFSVTTYLAPTAFSAWNPATGATRETALKFPSPVSFADAEVTRIFAVSKDGTKVPVNLIQRKGTKRDGTNPVLLYGYGGYGISMQPRFSGAFTRLWLDAGGVYAVANIRGGADYGEKWHREGMLTKKQNVFDDFAAAADCLVEQGYTTHSKLALMGGSNGGLLMGAEITQHPSLARAVVSAVGIYDMIRVELDPNGSFNTTEFGTVKDPAQFRALHAYSPYHHVRKGADYPAVLLLTGATDGRVNPLHSRKFAAALQSSGDGGRPVLLRTDKNSGHGIGSSLDERIAEQTDELSFLFDQLGMTWRPAPTN